MSIHLVTLNRVLLAFGHHPLLDHADLIIHDNERCGLIGRNGTGKSSLLKLIDQRLQPDEGEIMFKSGLRVATVEQEPDLPTDITIYDYLCGDYAETEDWQRVGRVGALIDQLGLEADALTNALSGGTRKRVALAKAMADEPDLLLLDEPTNHLDFDGILWLEQQLKQFKGSIVVITHDRAFLDSVATRIIELDRGQIFSFPGNFTRWQERKAEWLEAEAQQNAKFDKFLAQEEVWIRQGIKARRTRNEGRVRELKQLREERRKRREQVGNVNITMTSGDKSGKLVCKVKNLHLEYDGNVLVDDFSTTIIRGDKIGIIGPNGAGKTTLIKAILGESDDQVIQRGTVTLGTNLQIAFFDQLRDQLDLEASVAQNVSEGSDFIEVGGKKTHIMSYLQDFLFALERARTPVKALSGGERNRVLLAKQLLKPANIMVLDEPTNDLDMATLELLEESVASFDGTILLISHDRAFMDNVVTSTWVFDQDEEGNGIVKEYVGGYQDYLVQKQREDSFNAKAAATAKADNSKKVEKKEAATTVTAADKAPTAPKRKLSYNEQRELDELPNQISKLEEEQADLQQKLADGSWFTTDLEAATAASERLAAIDEELMMKLERWDELDS